MKLLMFALLACALVFSAFSPVWAGEADIDLKIEGQTLSVNVKEVPLKTILEKLKKETGIWIKGNESLLQGNISAQIDNLPLQEGLKRILGSMNYSLVFGPNDKLEGVVIVGKGKSRPTTARGSAISTQKTTSTAKSSTSSGPVKMTAEERKMFQVRKSSTPPGGPVTVTPEELEKFKVKKNVPPPGGPVTLTREELDKFKVIKNCGPPGGPVTVSPEEIDKFKVKKNVPPPGS